MKVSKDNVRYLVFEGGGGKGITYLGAHQALHELGILSFHKKIINGNLGIKTVSSQKKRAGDVTPALKFN